MNTPHYKRVLASAAVLGVAVVGPVAAPAQAAPGGNSGPAKQGQAKSGHASNGGKAKGHSSSHSGGGNGAAHANGHAKGHAGGGSRGHSGQPQGQANGHSNAGGGSAPASPGTGNGPKSGQGGQSGQGGNGGTGGNGGDPAGNNGTVKIETSPPGKDAPNNVPHVGCRFRVEWYGFDEGDDIVSTVNFAMHSPTADVELSGDRPRKVFVGGDPATGAGTETGFDGKQVYRLSFDGEPHAQQGYHVKLTIHTPGSIGADTKHKVFWVQPCEDQQPPGGNQTPPGGKTPPTVQGKQKTAKDHKAEVAGRQQVAPTSVNAAEVPTAVAAGVATTDAVPVTSPLPVLVATLGGLLAAVGFRRRRAA